MKSNYVQDICFNDFLCFKWLGGCMLVVFKKKKKEFKLEVSVMSLVS